MSVLTFDELNQLGIKRRSEPIDEYYEPMGISRQQKRKRIDTAEKYRDALLVYMRFVDEYGDEYGEISNPVALKLLHDEILDVVEDAVYVTAVWEDYVNRRSKQIHESTLRNKEKSPYFLSEDRATHIGEDESNSIWNYDELDEARTAGAMDKTWCTVGDNRVRETHEEVDGETIPIEEAFVVGGVEMMMPRDPEVDAPEETDGCRCWLEYS